MPTTTIPAVKAAIFELLKALPELNGIQIEWARPSFDAIKPDAIWFEGTKSTQKVEAMGNQRRDETYVLELVVSVIKNGDSARACEDRMWELEAIVEAWIRANPKPIPAPLFDIQFAGVDHVPHQAEGQRLSEAVVRIAARARI